MPYAKRLYDALRISDFVFVNAIGLGDLATGTLLAQAHNPSEPESLDLGKVVRAAADMLRTMIPTEGTVDDILITLRNQYHVIRPVVAPNAGGPYLGNGSDPNRFIYVACDRAHTNLVMARRAIATLTQQQDMQVSSGAESKRQPGMVTPPIPPLRRAVMEPRPEILPVEDVDDEEEELPPFMRDEVVFKLLGIPMPTAREVVAIPPAGRPRHASLRASRRAA